MKLCKVREHYHYTSEYTVAAHSLFNLKYSMPIKLLWFFTIDLPMVVFLS